MALHIINGPAHARRRCLIPIFILNAHSLSIIVPLANLLGWPVMHRGYC